MPEREAQSSIWHDYYGTHATASVVEEEKSGPTWSGLYNAAGQKLMRQPRREPIGFVVLRERE
jgi:hypothetical protein